MAKEVLERRRALARALHQPSRLFRKLAELDVELARYRERMAVMQARLAALT